MKRVFLWMLVLLAGALLTGCGTSQSAALPENAAKEVVQDNEPPRGGKTLVVYFSWSGNSADMAKYIQQQTGGDLLALQPSAPYPTDYEACTKAAKAELEAGKFPEIANLPADMAAYDTILIGYPIWWHTAPMIIGTFLQHYDWSGKKIYPFVQSAAMRQDHFDNSMAFVRKYARNAAVHDGLYAKSSDREKIQQWLKANNLLREK